MREVLSLPIVGVTEHPLRCRPEADVATRMLLHGLLKAFQLRGGMLL